LVAISLPTGRKFTTTSVRVSRPWGHCGLILTYGTATSLLALVVVLGLLLLRIRRRRTHLQERFGREYERAVADTGTGTAERRLSDVEHEHGDAAGEAAVAARP
jgi:hypothetical protein